MTKEELVKMMKFHRSEYEKLRDEWGKFLREEELDKHRQEQAKLLAVFKEKFRYYYGDKENPLKEIDWAEVEKLITSGTLNEGHSLGWDEHGTCGIGVSYYGGGGFQAMFEDELDMKRHYERQERIRDYERQERIRALGKKNVGTKA